ncbi:putative quinol monooxygenase [Gryllotalpicola sp.]|uniref:putative quinol monooxygenase n=1 Tax=Gryllotalpicola sp. TaxID=1932787 RepID=UPI00260CF4EA|nr:putative quinol monooxygenase [Gryllotalpicola sp.]
MSAGAALLYAEFTALSGHEEEVSALLARLAHDVRAEPGNVAFVPTRRPGRDGDFFVWEEYADQAAFQAHIGSAHSRAFNEALAPLVVGGASTLSWLEPL